MKMSTMLLAALSCGLTAMLVVEWHYALLELSPRYEHDVTLLGDLAARSRVSFARRRAEAELPEAEFSDGAVYTVPESEPVEAAA